MLSIRLKELRKENNFTQEDIAQKIGITKSAYGYYEQEKTLPDAYTLKKLAEIFDVSTDYLLGKTSSRHINDTAANPAKHGVKIPVLGNAEAGIPIEAIEDISDYEEIDEELARTGEFFALKVHGHSMEPRIMEGDVVIVRQQPDIENGQLAIVRVNGDEVTIKKIHKTQDGITLIPFNPAFDTKFYSNQEIWELPVVIVGRVVELRGKF